jgi:hypothetical protein
MIAATCFGGPENNQERQQSAASWKQSVKEDEES